MLHEESKRPAIQRLRLSVGSFPCAVFGGGTQISLAPRLEDGSPRVGHDSTLCLASHKTKLWVQVGDFVQISRRFWQILIRATKSGQLADWSRHS
eukprot:2181060-Rhodomonas_salina.1